MDGYYFGILNRFEIYTEECGTLATLRHATDDYRGLNHHEGNIRHFIDVLEGKCEPDFVFVCLGAPKQEKWIYENKDKLNAKILMGIGGSLDVFAKEAKRAPDIFIKLNIEWLYRLVKNPSRFKRMTALPKFAFEVIKRRKGE